MSARRAIVAVSAILAMMTIATVGILHDGAARPGPTPVAHCEDQGTGASFCYLDLPAGEWLFNTSADGSVTATWQAYPAR